MPNQANRPFNHRQMPKAGIFRRILGRPASKEQALTEIENILASKDLRDVSESEVATALAAGRLQPRDVTPGLLAFFERAVAWLAEDHELDDADRANLATLQRAFELTDTEASGAIERIVCDIFATAMRQALEDGVFTPDEKNKLEDTARALGLSTTQTKRVYDAAATEAIQSMFTAAIADQRYSEDEETKVNELARALGASVRHDDDTKRIVDRFRLLSRIDEGQLPVLQTGLLLQRGEVCHWSADAAHKELRSVTQRINYSGPTASIKIMKGVRWRVGSVAVQRVSSTVMVEVDSGTLYITNKRVFFDGAKKNTSITLGKVANFTVFKDGIQIEKGSGRDAYFVGEADWELAGAVLNAAYCRS